MKLGKLIPNEMGAVQDTSQVHHAVQYSKHYAVHYNTVQYSLVQYRLKTKYTCSFYLNKCT